MNGNDLLEFYESSHDGLEEEFCEIIKIDPMELEDPKEHERIITNNQDFWDFVLTKMEPQ